MALSSIKKLITVLDGSGNLIPAVGATAYVYVANTLTLKPLYSDRNGGVLISNPATIGADGYLTAYVESGALDLRVVNGLDESTHKDFLAVDDIVVSGPAGNLQFADVASMIAGEPLNQKSYKLDFGNYVGHKVSTVVNNTTSNEGGAEYIITNVDPGNLSTLVGGIWVGANHDLAGGFYAKYLPKNSIVDIVSCGVVADWDDTEKTGVDNTAAGQAAIDYAFDAGYHEVDLGRGSIFLTKWQVPSASNYSTAGMTIGGRGIRASGLYSDTSRPIEILPSDGAGGTATSYNVHLRDFSVRPANTGGTNGVFCDKLAFSTFHNLSVTGFDRCFYLLNNSFLNRFTKLYMSGNHDYGFRMDGSGTTNFWDQCYDFGAAVRAYKLTGDYSSIGSIAADACTGDYPYEFSFFSGSIGSLGSESCDCLRMITVVNSTIDIGVVTAFNNVFDSSANKGGIIRGTGSKLSVESIRVLQPETNVTAITGIIQAVTPTVTSVAHGRSTGETVRFTDVSGMGEINFLYDTITVTGTDTFTLDTIDTTLFTAYTSGGEATLSSTQSPSDFFETSFYLGHSGYKYENCHYVGGVAGSSSDNVAFTVLDGAGPISVSREGDGRPYLGYDRGALAFPNPDFRINGTNAVPKAIFLDMEGNPNFDTDGNDYSGGRPARIGDVFLESDPATNAQAGRIIDSTGATLAACSSLPISVEMNGSTASRPTLSSSRRAMYFDDTLGIPVWWDGTGWVDATGTTV